MAQNPFDQFNANPYIRTYAGAPINEALEVAKVMQMRHDKALTDMQQHEYVLSQIPGISATDKAYKQKYGAELAAEFEKLKEAPEMAQQAIDALASKYKQDPTLQAMATYAGKKKEWEAMFAKDPAKYGDVASYEMQQAIKAYEEAGGAAGGAVFKAPELYELKDVNQFLRDNADAINASSNGQFVYNEAKGSIETATGESISFEKAQQVLNDAMMGDPAMRRQLSAQYRYEKGARGYTGDFSSFLSQTTQGVANATAYTKYDSDAKGWDPSKGGSGSSMAGGDWGVAVGQDAIMNIVPNYESVDDVINSRKNRGNTAADARATAAEDRVWNEGVAAWEAAGGDPMVARFLKQGIQTIPGSETIVYDENTAGGAAYTPGSYSGTTQTSTQRRDTQVMLDWAKAQGMSPQEQFAFAGKVNKALESVWAGDMSDRMSEANKVAYQTRWATPEAEFGTQPRGAATIKAMNSQADFMMRNMPTVTGHISGAEETGALEMTQEEMNETYETYEVKAWDTAGSGQIQILAKRRDKQGYDTITLPKTQETADMWKNFEALEVNRANAAPPGSRERSKYSARALSISQPELVQQVKPLDSQTNYTNQPIALNFGRMDGIIQQDFGQFSLGKDPNGDYIVTLNGANAFANNEQMNNVIKNAPSADAAFAEIMQYFQRQYGASN
jgi:hypothetical protein